VQRRRFYTSLTNLLYGADVTGKAGCLLVYLFPSCRASGWLHLDMIGFFNVQSRWQNTQLGEVEIHTSATPCRLRCSGDAQECSPSAYACSPISQAKEAAAQVQRRNWKWHEKISIPNHLFHTGCVVGGLSLVNRASSICCGAICPLNSANLEFHSGINTQTERSSMAEVNVAIVVASDLSHWFGFVKCDVNARKQRFV